MMTRKYPRRHVESISQTISQPLCNNGERALILWACSSSPTPFATALQVKGIAEGLSIKLGEMMDQPRHQRIAKLAKIDEERKKGVEAQQQSKQQEQARRAKLEAQKQLNLQVHGVLS